MKKRRGSMLLILLLLVMVFTMPAQAAKSKVKLNRKEASIQVGQTIKLRVKGKKGKVKWISTNKSVATVTKKGLVKGIHAGVATIKARMPGKTLKCQVSVYDPASVLPTPVPVPTPTPTPTPTPEPTPTPTPEPTPTNPVTSVSVTPSTLQLKITSYGGGYGYISAMALPYDADDRDVSLTSSNTRVATVNSSGRVDAISKGTAVITASTANGTKGTCTVTVTEQEVKKVSIYESDKIIDLGVGDEEKIENNVEPYDAVNKTLKWTSSNNIVATVDSSGKVTAVSKGTAIITATAASGAKDTSTVTVHDVSFTVPSLPKSISYYGYQQTLYSTCLVNKVEFQKLYYSWLNEFSVQMWVTGTKTYDYNPTVSSRCAIGWKLYDANNIVVGSGTFLSDSVFPNENFRGYTYIDSNLPEGNYRLELLNVS